jgi:integrase
MSGKVKITEKWQRDGVFQKWSKRKKTMLWYCRLDHACKPFRAGPFATKTEAKEALTQLRTKIQKGVVRDKVTFTEYGQDFLAAARLETPETAKQYAQRLRHLLPFFGNMKIDQIKPVDIKAYRKHRLSQKQPPKPATINRELATLSKIFTTALEDEKILYHPMAKRKLKLYEEKEPPKVLSDDGRLRLMAACKLDPKFEPFEPMIVFGLNTGMRAMEVVNLKWKDVDLATRVIAVVKSKSKKPRYIPMNDAVYELLMSLDRTTTYVFPFNRTGDYRSRFEDWFGQLCTLAGVPIRFHGLRSTFATTLTGRKVPISVVQALLGHSTPVVTQRYVLTDHFLEDAVKVLDSKRQKTRHNSDDDSEEDT